MTATTFISAFGTFELLRRPPTPLLPLQAWDAADEYLLALAGERLGEKISADAPTLIINDQFGALALLTKQTRIVSWGDSFTAHLATQENLQRNSIDTTPLTILPATQMPSEKFARVLWRIPKNSQLMQQQAAALRACTDSDTIIFAAGMQKHLPQQTVDVLGTLGHVDYLLTQKKARAYRITPNSAQPHAPTKSSRVKLSEFQLTLEAGPNVFAHDKFDIGARFFIEQFEKLPRAQRIADLGCGNGVLGLRMKQLQPWAQIEFFDESYQAIAAAQTNYSANTLDKTEPSAQFHTDDGFSHFNGEPFDIILCNPPFHQGHVIGDHIAWQMFTQSKQHLRNGGELWIVGNRHLDYQLKLKKVFGNCKQIAANTKFVVLAARTST